MKENKMSGHVFRSRQSISRVVIVGIVIVTMIAFVVVLALVLPSSLSSNISLTTVNNKHVMAGELIFDEEFDTLDLDRWQHEITLSGGGNWEFQVYSNTRTNSYVHDGNLFIKPTLLEDRYGAGFATSGTLSLWGGAPADQCTNPSFYGCERVGTPSNALNPTMSARIRTLNSFSFRYGKVEVRAKLPSGDWLWPAIWLLPLRNAYGTWPASGEIDLMESRGNLHLMQNGANIGVEQAASTLHWGPYWPYNGYEKTSWRKNQSPGFNTDFHRYQLEWTPDYLAFSLDDVEIGRVTPPAGGFWEMGQFDSNIQNPWRYASKMAPFDQEFYLIINLAVGGTNGYFPDDAANDGSAAKPWSNTGGSAFVDFWNGRNGWYNTWDKTGENDALQVDYVKVWAL